MKAGLLVTDSSYGDAAAPAAPFVGGTYSHTQRGTCLLVIYVVAFVVACGWAAFQHFFLRGERRILRMKWMHEPVASDTDGVC